MEGIMTRDQVALFRWNGMKASVYRFMSRAHLRRQKTSPLLIVGSPLWISLCISLDPIVEAYTKADPEGAAYYQERGRLLAAQMSAAHEAVHARLHAIPSEKRYLVTSHDAFHYFTRSYLAETNE